MRLGNGGALFKEGNLGGDSLFHFYNSNLIVGIVHYASGTEKWWVTALIGSP
jgi:hypothetical protein